MFSSNFWGAFHVSSSVTSLKLHIYNYGFPKAIFPFVMATAPLPVLFILLARLAGSWLLYIIMGFVSISTTRAVLNCRNWFYTFHFLCVEIGICISIKITSWCRVWLIACDKDILRPYISRICLKCLAVLGCNGNVGLRFWFTLSFLSFRFLGRGSDCSDRAVWIRELKECQWQSTFAGNLEIERFVSLLAKPHPVERRRLFRLDWFL